MNTKVCTMMLCMLALADAALAATNAVPTVQVISAGMRPGTSLMDVVYKITDPDDATVKVRALAFKDGTRSFANVIRPVTFVENTQTNIGDSITTGVNHTLTWDVRADWNIDLANVKFEVLCRDSRGLLPFDWITIPTTTNTTALTISKNAPTDTQVLDALFWQYAVADSGITITNGVLIGSGGSGVFAGSPLVSGAVLKMLAPAYIYKQMNLAQADSKDITFAVGESRAGIGDPSRWHALNLTYSGLSVIVGWGDNFYGQINVLTGLGDVIAITAGSYHCLALTSYGTVVAWGINNADGPLNVPSGLTNVTAIAAKSSQSFALKRDGTVVAWGNNSNGQTSVPAGLANIAAIAAGERHSLALKSNGTVVAWGSNSDGQTSVPLSLTNVTAIAAGQVFSLALKDNGTVVAWGGGSFGQTSIPSNLTNVVAIAAGDRFSLALKSNGTVVAWGYNNKGQTSVPVGLTNVIAIAAGYEHGLALKSDGSVVAWGNNEKGQIDVLPGLTGVTALAGGYGFSLALKSRAP